MYELQTMVQMLIIMQQPLILFLPNYPKKEKAPLLVLLHLLSIQGQHHPRRASLTVLGSNQNYKEKQPWNNEGEYDLWIPPFFYKANTCLPQSILFFKVDQLPRFFLKQASLAKQLSLKDTQEFQPTPFWGIKPFLLFSCII